MQFANDYKLIYVKGTGEDRKLYASKESIPTEEDAELDPNLDALEGVKLVYVKDGQFYASKESIPTDEDEAAIITCGGEALFESNDSEEAPENPEAGDQEESEKEDPEQPKDGDDEEDEEEKDKGDEDDGEDKSEATEEQITSVDELDPKNYNPENTHGSGLTLNEDGNFVVNTEGAWLNKKADFENYSYAIEFDLASDIEKLEVESSASIEFDAGTVGSGWGACTGPKVDCDGEEHHISFTYEIEDTNLVIKGFVDSDEKAKKLVAKDALGDSPELYWDIYKVTGISDVFTIKNMVIKTIPLEA